MTSSLIEPNARSRFRLIGLLEGMSYLLLLGVAMPMKYMMGLSWAVKYTGWAHGVLFVAYFVALFWAALEYKWNLKKIFLAGLVSLLPFGTFALDKHVKTW